MSIYHNLEQITLVSIHKAKEHNCNYNIIILNPIDGKFDQEQGSTYEMVVDSYFEKDRPNAIILHKTDDLIAKEQAKQ